MNFELSQILEKIVTNSVSNLFLLSNHFSKESFYSDKYINYWKGFEKIFSVRKVPINLRKIIFTDNTIYFSLSLGNERLFEGKTQIYTYKQENITLIFEVNYRGVVDNIMPAIQNILEKEIQPTLLFYHKKLRPLIVEGEEIVKNMKELFENIDTEENKIEKESLENEKTNE